MEEERGLASSAQASRWISNYQIKILECLFRHEIQTPSASQIQKITSKLRDYGSIDENNVFIWFQNYHQHKNEESSVHHHTPLFPLLSPPSHQLPPLTPQAYTNGFVYNPFSLPPGLAGSVGNYHSQYPNIILPEVTKKRPVPEHQSLEMAINGYISGASNRYVSRKTLQVFPLHPDGTLSSFARSQNKRRRIVEEDGNERISTFFKFFGGCNGD